MSTKKNNNSILFLTTLGVYIGLLVSGSSPSVIAQQAALARSFDVKDEIEIKDDLDKKPDDCPILARGLFASSDQPNSNEEILASYVSLVENYFRIADLSEPIQISRRIRTHYLPNPQATDSSNRFTLGQLRHAGIGFIPLDPRFSEMPFSLEKAFDLSIESNDSFAQLSITLDQSSEVRSRLLATDLRSGIEYAKERFFSLTAVKILLNTEVRRSGNQVLLVTHLPRAALDELLASDAK